MRAAGPEVAFDPHHEVDVYVSADGSVIPVDGKFVLQGGLRGHAVPAELVDLALGFVAENAVSLGFVWTGDSDESFWKVHLERSSLGRGTVARLQASRCEALDYGLTRRELDVVTLMIAGLSNAAVAEALTVSPRTVTTHVDHIMRKTASPSRSAVATLALDRGLIGVPFPVDASELQTLRIGRVVGSAGRRVAVQQVRERPGREGPVLIGSMVPLEGRAREDGVEMIRGASLAIDEINARGGIRGRELQLIVHHVDVDASGLTSVAEATHRLLSRGVHAITSGYLQHQATAVDLAAVEGVPLLHASASSYIDEMVARDPARFGGTFQVCPNDRNYAPSFVDFMTLLRDSGEWIPQSRELVVAQQGAWDIIDFGLDLAAQKAELAGWDLRPVTVSDRENSGTAWSRLPEMLGKPAAVMLGSFFSNDHLQFLEAFAKHPTHCLLYSIYAPSVPAFRRRAGRTAEGLLWASTTGTYSDDIAHNFAEAYRTKFDALPGRSMAGIAYDRVQILAQAWYQVEDVHNYDQVTSTLLRTRYRGVNGSYCFATPGHGTVPLGTSSDDPSISQAHTIFQLQQGRHVLLDPGVYATGRFARPSWFRR